MQVDAEKDIVKPLTANNREWKHLIVDIKPHTTEIASCMTVSNYIERQLISKLEENEMKFYWFSIY